MDASTAPTSVPPQAQVAPTAPPRRRRLLRKLFVRVWLPLVAVFVVYLYFSFRARGFDSAILRSDALVAVTHTPDTVTFAPVGTPKRASLIFIPGALVEPAAYAPLARSVALEGYTVIIVPLPARTASFEWQRRSVMSRVRDVIKSGDPSARWVVAGHSAGGVVACHIARDHADPIDGLVLIGTSHPRDFDLSGVTLDVTKISASRDGLASPSEVQANAKKLPPRTHWVVIEGGNHSQFGYYGFQLGDRTATLSRAEQQSQTTQALREALRRVDSADGPP